MSAFRGSSGLFFSFALILVTTEMIFGSPEGRCQFTRANSLGSHFSASPARRGATVTTCSRFRIQKSGVEHNLKVIRYAQRVVSGVGGSGRRPVSPPTPMDEGGGVGVKKRACVRS